MTENKNKILLDCIKKFFLDVGFKTLILDHDYCIKYMNLKKQFLLKGTKQDLDILAFDKTGKLMLLVESTQAQSDKKQERKLAIMKLKEIENNLSNVVEFLKDNKLVSTEDYDNLIKYLKHSNSNIRTTVKKIFLNLNDDFIENQEDNVYLIDGKRFIYFNEIINLLGEFTKYELYSYLDISPKGMALNIDDFERSSLPYPNPALKVAVGPLANMEMYVFKISPANLLKYVKVIRNKQWEEKAYQRSLDQKKLKSIQEYVVSNKNRFPNNIIVTLPNNSKFIASNEEGFGNLTFDQNFNSLCLIDGQHRLFAFVKLLNKNIDASEFEKIKEEYQLIVTGVKFLPGSDFTKEEAKLFSDINTTQLKVNQDLLDTILTHVNPQHKRATSKSILIHLNSNGFFRNKFKLFKLENKLLKKYENLIDVNKYKSEINTNTIIGSGLVQLIKPNGNFYKTYLENSKNQTTPNFVVYSCNKICNFFGTLNKYYMLKNNNQDIRTSDIFDTFAIVAFLRLMNSFYTNSILESDFDEMLSKILFIRKPEYISSQFNVFVKDMQDEMKHELDLKNPNFKYIKIRKL
ncbi:DGQHR domain-containing protein [Candidatus Woesearchaeota archaeon]|nr:DGQHR domain-containing protein [Candidatus Woesearchaeota archaeon]